MTKHYSHMKMIYGLLCSLCTIGPIVYYIVRAMVIATPAQKTSIGFMALAAIIIGIVNLLMKVHPRCLFWMVLLAMYYVLGNIYEVLLVMFITSFLDEIWFSPMYNYSKQKLSINKEIDKRNG